MRPATVRGVGATAAEAGKRSDSVYQVNGYLTGVFGVGPGESEVLGDSWLSEVRKKILMRCANARRKSCALAVDQPLTEFGMDSLMLAELQIGLEGQFGIAIPTLKLMDLATVAKLGRRIIETIGIDPTGNVLLPRPTPIPLPTANQKHWPSQRWSCRSGRSSNRNSIV